MDYAMGLILDTPRDLDLSSGRHTWSNFVPDTHRGTVLLLHTNLHWNLSAHTAKQASLVANILTAR